MKPRSKNPVNTPNTRKARNELKDPTAPELINTDLRAQTAPEPRTLKSPKQQSRPPKP